MHKQKIIISETQLPEGYVRMITYGKGLSGALSIAAKEGKIPSFKLMKNVGDVSGPVYIDQARTDRWLKNRRNSPIVTEATSERPINKTEFDELLAKLNNQNQLLEKIAADLGCL